jgi:transitional endoplasmic reticulum ATPase
MSAFRLGDDTHFDVDAADFDAALARVRPSALRESLVTVPAVDWSDIGGLAEVKRTIRQLVEEPLRRPDDFRKAGLGSIGGVLLHGAPGTGKTMLVHALAASTGVNFLAVDGPEIFSKWLGESEQAIRHVFKVARQLAPAIVFFDQLDAVAPHRGVDSGTKTTERVVSQLLTELDAVRDIPDIVVVGATNRIDLIDPAILRPGRFGVRVTVALPDAGSRAEILEMLLRSALARDEDAEAVCRRLAEATEGWSGAELADVVNRARVMAVADHADDLAVREADVEALLERADASLGGVDASRAVLRLRAR